MGNATLVAIETHTRTELERESLILKVHDLIGDVMETYKGKQVTKRALVKVREALKDLFPAESIMWLDGPVTTAIGVWGKGTPWLTYDKRQTWDLGYPRPMFGFTRDANTPDSERRHLCSNYGGRAAFENQSPATGKGARERNASRAALLASPDAMRKLANAIDTKRAADRNLKALLEFDENSPYQADRYDFEKLAEGK